MSQVKELRDRLSELFVNELGNWVYPNNGIKPSIAVVPPFLDQNIAIYDKGVECLIYQSPTIKPIELIGSYVEEKYWEIELIQYDTNKTLESCHILINAVFQVKDSKEKKQNEKIVKGELQIEEERASFQIPDNNFADNFLVSNINEVVLNFYS